VAGRFWLHLDNSAVHNSQGQWQKPSRPTRTDSPIHVIRGTHHPPTSSFLAKSNNSQRVRLILLWTTSKRPSVQLLIGFRKNDEASLRTGLHDVAPCRFLWDGELDIGRRDVLAFGPAYISPYVGWLLALLRPTYYIYFMMVTDRGLVRAVPSGQNHGSLISEPSETLIVLTIWSE
jgi:hypothetical protein